MTFSAREILDRAKKIDSKVWMVYRVCLQQELASDFPEGLCGEVYVTSFGEYRFSRAISGYTVAFVSRVVDPDADIFTVANLR